MFRQPRDNGGNLAYFGVGRISGIEPDGDTGLFYAMISQHLRFDRPVPWRDRGRYFERPLRELDDITQVGLRLRGRSVRELDEADFAAIVATGMRLTFEGLAAEFSGDSDFVNLSSPDRANEPEIQRKIVQALVSRKVRDRSFRETVLSAYRRRCAVTGLKIADSFGRVEAQAAHIWSVAAGGPDTVTNGISLCCTLHWLFDRHLFTVSENFELVASDSLSDACRKLLFANGSRLELPESPAQWPGQHHLERHRIAYYGLAKSSIQIRH